MDKLEKVFKVVSFFDDFRWRATENYNQINFFDDTIDDDSKILTHWLCYITDRQMPFMTIWDVGGFVFSELVHEIKKTKNIDILKPNAKDSFLQQGQDGKYFFLGKSAPNKRILDNYSYNYIDSNQVKFKSRFLPSDYKCILSTLLILQDFHFNLAEYISVIFNKYNGKDDIIIRILFSLYLLTYSDIGQNDSANIDNYEKMFGDLKIKKTTVLDIIKNEAKFESDLQQFKKSAMFKQKRAWCSLRDFIKSQEFHPFFKKAMAEQGISNEKIAALTKTENLAQFVLPGDVWNNNSKFRKCVLESTQYENSTEKLNVILDDYYKKFKPKIGYPEQFDITFDFAPRMCEKGNCNICPVKHPLESWQKICVNNADKYCPVALYACGYRGDCFGKEKCKLVEK